MEKKELTFADFKDICRLCSSAGRKIGIFEEEGQIRQIGYKIRVCLRDLIYPGDPLPQSICPECLFVLEDMYAFRKKYLKNYSTLANILLEVENLPEVARFIRLSEDGIYPIKPVISISRPVDQLLIGNIDGFDDIDWLPGGPSMHLAPEEAFQIFVQDGSADTDDLVLTPEPDDLVLTPEPDDLVLMPEPDDLVLMPEPDDLVLIPDPGGLVLIPEPGGLVLIPEPGGLVLIPEPGGLAVMNTAEASQDYPTEPRSKEDSTEQSPEAAISIENSPTNAGQPTAECSSTMEEILGRIKQEPEEVDEGEVDEQQIMVTWLMQPADQEDALDISRIKTEPVPFSLEMVKKEPSEPAAFPTMATNTVEVKEEASTSSAQSRTRSKKMNVECSKCFLVFHRETEILRHRCIGVTPWYCESCKKYYKTKETFSRHKRINCHSKEHTCTPCGRVFSNKIELAQHQVVHLKVKITKLDVTKLNTCKICLQTLSSKASLNMHERAHLNVKEREHYLRSSESMHERTCLNVKDREHYLRSSDSHNRAIPQITEAHSGLLHSSSRNVPAQQCAKVTRKQKNQYHCTVCKAVFTNQKVFNAHNRQHGLKNPYRNKKRPVAFKTDRKKGQQERLQPAALKLEATDKNLSAVIYTCIICRKSFDTQEILIEHKKLHTTAKPSRPFSYFTAGNDTVSVSEWICKICGLECRNSKVLWNHVHAKHLRNYKCNHCQKTFGKLCSLKSHEKIHEPKLSCTACGKQYATLKTLAAHEQKKHVPPTGTHLCRKCNIKFDSRSALLIHARNHQSFPRGKKSFVAVPSKPRGLHTCSICKKTFTRYDSLKRHKNTHAKRKQTCYPCQICPSEFTSVSKYRAHTEDHFHKMSKTHCSTCKQTFFTRDYNNHSCVKWQNGPSTSQAIVIKKFKCELCNAAFGTQQARNSHMRIHRKNWKHSTQRVKSNTSVYQNIAQTSGNIPLPIYCPLCSKAFLSKDELRQHVRLLHPKK